MNLDLIVSDVVLVHGLDVLGLVLGTGGSEALVPHELVELVAAHLRDVDLLDHAVVGVVEHDLRGFAGDLECKEE